ncbi:beta strand repeat-containing protein [Mucilaginibacter antarcticus]|uniref:beta strand repeat-containing protein n=1 Tax=Mucilaginibacter antarcticus TaxID=1855725 RepID=UPI00362A2C0C
MEGGYVVCTVTETIPAGSTYYYFFVANCTNTTYQAYSNYSFDFVSGQGTAAIITSPYALYNTYNIAGTDYAIGGVYDWVGSNSTDVATAANWRVNGGTPGSAPSDKELIRIGVVAYQGSALQPSYISGPAASAARIQFGSNNNPVLTLGSSITGVTLTNGFAVDANSTATITTANPTAATITLPATAQSVLGTGSTLNYNGILSVAGTLSLATGSTLNLTTANGKLSNASDITTAGTITVAGQSSNSGTISQTGTNAVTFSSTGAFANSGNITLAGTGTFSIAGALTNTANITKSTAGNMSFAAITNTSPGTITLGSGTNNITGAVTNASGASFTLGSGTTTFSSTINNTGAFDTGSGNATFTGALTNNSGGTLNLGTAGIKDLNGASFPNAGAVTMSGGTANIVATTFSNAVSTGTFIASGGTVNFDRAGAQAINNANTTTPVTFNNLNITVSGTKTLNGAGKFVILSSGTITLATTGTTIFNPGTALLTLNSDAAGSASLATLPTGTSITPAATVTVQRYMTGGTAAYRGYRLLSSPINSGGTGFYDLSYLTNANSGSYLTGATSGGFDATGNPTLFLYRDDKTPDNTSFLTGNYRAITKINNAPLYNIGTIDGTINLPVGTGVLYFYRGNSSTNAAITPASLTFSRTGRLNTGNIAVKFWPTGATGLSNATATGNAAVKGFNLIGNPYASSIDWDQFGTNITASNVSSTMYIYNPQTKTYASYTAGGINPGTGWNSGTANSDIIPSGQGFL